MGSRSAVPNAKARRPVEVFAPAEIVAGESVLIEDALSNPFRLGHKRILDPCCPGEIGGRQAEKRTAGM